MTVAELIAQLSTYNPELPVYMSAPVQGDCENIRNMVPHDLFYDVRYPAVVVWTA